MRLHGRIAVVTGGAAGIGRATAMLFAREGATVIVADTARPAGEAVAAAIVAAGGQAQFVAADVSDEAAVARVTAAAAALGDLHILFNNAGIEQPVTPSDQLDSAMFDRVIGVNLRGTFLACRAAIPLMLQSGGGCIVNNSSVSAFANVGGNLAYAASKGAVMSLTRVLAIEYARRNIRVNAICPGVIDTEMNARNLSRAPDAEAARAGWMNATPMGRMGTPDEVAETVLYLASAQSGFVTGIGLLIDGGRVAT